SWLGRWGHLVVIALVVLFWRVGAKTDAKARTPAEVVKLSPDEIDELIGACTYHEPKARRSSFEVFPLNALTKASPPRPPKPDQGTSGSRDCVLWDDFEPSSRHTELLDFLCSRFSISRPDSPEQDSPESTAPPYPSKPDQEKPPRSV